jgi:hypothetical protein
MPRVLTNHTCEWDGCSERTKSRYDGVTPLKYCPTHTPMARARFKAMIGEQKAAKAERDEMFKVVLDEAMLVGETAREAANPLSSSRAATLVLGPKNHRFVNYLRNIRIGDDGAHEYLVRFPALPGSFAQAEAVRDTLRPLTMSGESLSGLRVEVR